MSNLNGLGQLRLPKVKDFQDALVDSGVKIAGFAAGNIGWGFVSPLIPEAIGGFHPAVKPALRVTAGLALAPMVKKLGGKWGADLATGFSLAMVGGGLLGLVNAFAPDLIPDAALQFGQLDTDDTLLLGDLGAAALQVEEPMLGAAPLFVTDEVNPVAGLM